MRYRLTLEQKVDRIMRVLLENNAHMSAPQIGKELGFKDGRPIRDILNVLVAKEWLETRAVYYSINGGIEYRLRDECRDDVRADTLVVLTRGC